MISHKEILNNSLFVSFISLQGVKSFLRGLEERNPCNTTVSTMRRLQESLSSELDMLYK